MSQEHIIEMANVGQEDWDYAVITDYLLTMYEFSTLPLGTTIVRRGASGIDFKYRKVPKDPLLKEMVLAKVKQGDKL